VSCCAKAVAARSSVVARSVIVNVGGVDDED
jgi:hypothetical protein